MRKVLIALAATAGSALALATPAAAQYFPQPQGYGYGQNHGYQGQWGHARALQARVDGIQRQIRQLSARRLISRGEAASLRERSRQVEQRLRRAAHYGLSPYEAQDVQRRIARLEQRLYRDVRDGHGYGHGHWGNGQQGYYADGGRDRDRDGRDDRYEDDRGRDRDGRDGRDWDRDDD
jgi:hypothetical protein